MKKEICLLGLILFIISSCAHKELWKEGNTNQDPLENYDPDFDFTLRSDRLLTLIAKHPDGKVASGVPFSVFLENPYGNEGKRLEDVQAIYGSSTDANGVLTIKLSIPNSVKTLHIYTPYAGFGSLQTCEVSDHMSLTFQGNTPETKTRTIPMTFANGDYEPIIRPGNVYHAANHVYYYYANPIQETFTGILINNGASNIDPQMIRKEDITTGISATANNLFKERVAVDNEEYFKWNSDLHVTAESGSQTGTYQGTQVWVTFIGDGGFSINNGDVTNSLCYYTYKTGTVPNATAIQTMHKTMLFPNTNVNQSRPGRYLPGTKIQLMYWDETQQKYTSLFPAGVSIGWIMVAGSFGGIKELDSYRFSTPELNDRGQQYGGKFANGIARWSDNGYCIVGMENRFYADPNLFNDKDYNDILFKVEADPVIKPETEIPVPDEDYKYGQSGTLAFEDNWPNKGDYDFNDFVTNYTYSLVKKSIEDDYLKSISMTFTPKAVGALFTSGFGIQLPVKAIHVAEVENGELENPGKNELAVVIVYQNTRDAFEHNEKYINTQSGNTIGSTPIIVNVKLNENTVSGQEEEISMLNRFNPFIYVTTRGKEVHLADMEPTSRADTKLFGTGDDDSNSGKYYRMQFNAFPWALDIPSVTSTTTWQYPIEEVKITDAYLDYATWITANGHLNDWVNGNKIATNLYVFK